MLSHRHHHAALPPRRRQPGRAALIAPTQARETDSAETAFRLKRFAWSLSACIMQRRYGDAAALLESAAVDDPAEPQAYLRLARLTRDHLDDPRRALEWFGHARATHRLTPGERRRVDDEVAALRGRLDDSSNDG